MNHYSAKAFSGTSEERKNRSLFSGILEADPIHAVPLIGRVRKALVFEHVTEVAIAICANDFYAPAIAVRYLFDSARQTFVESWPPTPTVELGYRFVKWRLAASALVDALGWILGAHRLFKFIFQLSLSAGTVAWGLRSLFAQDFELHRREPSHPPIIPSCQS